MKTKCLINRIDVIHLLCPKCQVVMGCEDHLGNYTECVECEYESRTISFKEVDEAVDNIMPCHECEYDN